MFLVPDSRFDNVDVEGVWNQTDNEIVCGDGSVKCVAITDIQGDGLC